MPAIRNVPPNIQKKATHFGLLAAILAVAAAVRLLWINSEALWGDEALTLVLVQWPLKVMLLEPVDPTPVLYYALHKLSSLQPDDSAGLIRSISFLCGLAAVATMYALGRLAHGARAGLLAAALLAVWPPHVDYSQEARAYALLFLLTLASGTSLLWWHRLSGDGEGRKRILALTCFVLTTALSFYAHLVATFWIFLALQIFVIAAIGHRPRRTIEAFLALAAMLVLAAPGLIRLARQFVAPTNFNWLRQASGPEFVEKTASILLPFDRLWMQAAVLLAGVALLWFARRRQREPGEQPDTIAQLVMLAFLFLPLMVWGIGFSIRPIFMERSILFAVPGAILAIVALAEAVPNRRIGNAFGVLLTAGLALMLLLNGPMRPREDWRGAYAALKPNVRQGDLILLCAWQFPSLRHATQEPLPAPLVFAGGGTPLLLEQRLGERRDWPRLFFKYDIEPVTRQASRGRPDKVAARVDRGSSVWLIESDCPAPSRSSIDDWVGKDGWEKVWTSTPAPRPSISVSRLRMNRDLSLPALAPPELAVPKAAG